MRADRVLGAIVFGLAVFVAWRAVLAPHPRPAPAATDVPADAPGSATERPDGIVARVTATLPPAVAIARAREARDRIAAEGADTYIGALLAEQDSIIRRWPDRADRPVRVWLQTTTAVDNYRVEYVTEVQQALDAWQLPDTPIRFLFVPDSAAAELRVTWTDRFPASRVGVTRASAWNDTLVAADIRIATHRTDGSPLEARDIHRIALHEAGHALGLPHDTAATSIMHGGSRADSLADRDRATLRLLYRLPWGDTRRR